MYIIADYTTVSHATMDVYAYCKITAGHWPISDCFPKMANQNFTMVYSLRTHGQQNLCGIGKMFKFLILHSDMCIDPVLPHPWSQSVHTCVGGDSRGLSVT